MGNNGIQLKQHEKGVQLCFSHPSLLFSLSDCCEHCFLQCSIENLECKTFMAGATAMLIIKKLIIKAKCFISSNVIKIAFQSTAKSIRKS